MTDAERTLQAASDTLLRDLDLLAQMELEKRKLGAANPKSHELAARIEELAARVLEITAHQRALTIVAQQQAAGATRRTPSAILVEWREAERRAGAAGAGSPGADDARAEADRLREEYRRAFDEQRKRGGATF